MKNALEIEIEYLKNRLAAAESTLKSKTIQIQTLIANDDEAKMVESLDDETKEIYYLLFGSPARS